MFIMYVVYIDRDLIDLILVFDRRVGFLTGLFFIFCILF